MDAKKVIVIGITGFSGGGSNEGIPKMVRKFKGLLKNKFGVPNKNVFHAKWNPHDNMNPTAAPDVDMLKELVDSIEPNPEYLAIIGHSFGGWAAARLSRKFPQTPNFVGLIDMVYNVGADHVIPKGASIINWYQKKSVPNGERLHHLSGVKNIHISMQQTWKRKSMCQIRVLGVCIRKKRTSHTLIDENQRVWRDIYDKISADLSSLIG